jgi:hypothetical protein
MDGIYFYGRNGAIGRLGKAKGILAITTRNRFDGEGGNSLISEGFC